MRTFIAIELDNELKAYLSNVRDIVKDKSIKGNYTRDDNFHITIRYLGETQISTIKKLQTELKQICCKYKATSLSIGNIGAFRKGNRSIIYLQPQIDQSISHMRNEIEAAVCKLGFPPDSKEFYPHITLGREVNIEIPPQQIQQFISPYQNPVKADGISLMESTTENGRLVYKRIFKIKY